MPQTPERRTATKDENTDGVVGLELLQDGRYAEALEAHRRFLDAALIAGGPMHPDVGRAFGNLGLAYDGLGRPHEALAMHRAARSVLSNGGGQDAARAAHSAGAACYRLGRLNEARAHLEEARAAWAAAAGPWHPGVADALGGIGTVLLNQVGAEISAPNVFRGVPSCLSCSRAAYRVLVPYPSHSCCDCHRFTAQTAKGREERQPTTKPLRPNCGPNMRSIPAFIKPNPQKRLQK